MVESRSSKARRWVGVGTARVATIGPVAVLEVVAGSLVPGGGGAGRGGNGIVTGKWILVGEGQRRRGFAQVR